MDGTGPAHHRPGGALRLAMVGRLRPSRLRRRRRRPARRRRHPAARPRERPGRAPFPHRHPRRRSPPVGAQAPDHRRGAGRAGKRPGSAARGVRGQRRAGGVHRRGGRAPPLRRRHPPLLGLRQRRPAGVGARHLAQPGRPGQRRAADAGEPGAAAGGEPG